MNKINIINLTPHTINILKRDFLPYAEGNARKIIWAEHLKILPSGNVLNCPSYTDEEAYIEYGEDKTVPLTYTTYGPPKGLPPFIPDTIYIVSDIVARQCPDRNDFRVVNGLIREDGGRVIGCRSLGRIKPPVDIDTLKSLRDDVVRVEGLLETYGAFEDGEDYEANIKHTTTLFNKIQSLMQSVCS